ncbi:M14 family metallopeptidase [Reichenbachiella carrageenanivorans]|uniref:M14 family metallopeptidase n=1 Tax=Reichenbachiella carrageenanivorans TaxID=2979869 RepID=A0ABY6D126_9BACT|nr:M14 family metallopeptidase [Reichenbachiella carrageenanivorans]UXX79870.1 M14 family metallopeptidase [Reichenbachiella carrageenanivorans]
MRIKIGYGVLVYIVYGLACVSIGAGCSVSQKGASTYDFPKPVDTHSKTIAYQEKKVYATAAGLYASNLFDGARLNNFRQISDSSFYATIMPENEPINQSAWYAFKLWRKEASEQYVTLEYPTGKHRFYPKLSHDGVTWSLLDSARILYDSASQMTTLKLEVSSDTLWVAAQEVLDAKMGLQWCETISESELVTYETIGRSALGRQIPWLQIKEGDPKGKKMIVVLSRQHPPEVTGYLAMQAFIEGLLQSDQIDEFLEEYQVFVYPLINPDGVDLGHWRHNSGGVDLNRDWAYYRQPETRLVANHLANAVDSLKAQVILGLDFHSTFHDVYYTLDADKISVQTIPWLRNQWFASLENQIEGYHANESAAGLGTPVTKGWFYTQFGAEGITYEIGDSTPRDEIQTIGSVSAQELIKILLQSDL